MPLSMEEKTNIARHLRYPILGMAATNTSGGTLAVGTAISYRYTQAYGQLMWRLNGNLAANEECRITGKAYGSLTFIGPVPNVGDTSTITITGGGLASPVVLTLTATAQLINSSIPAPQVSPIASQYFNANIGLGLAAQVALLVAQSPALVAAGFTANAPYGTGPYGQTVIPVPEVNIINSTPFTISVVNNGLMAVQVQANGALLPPYLNANSLPSTLYGFLPILDFLEAQHAGASNVLLVDTADVFKARKTVIAETFALYQTWVQKLADFLDVPINVNHKGNFGSVTPRVFM